MNVPEQMAGAQSEAIFLELDRNYTFPALAIKLLRNCPEIT
jgi:hypothetical protein